VRSQSVTVRIDLPHDYRPDLVLRYLGRDSDSLCERVQGNTIETATLTITLARDHAICNGPVEVAMRLLGLTMDNTGLERAHPDLVRGHEGARLPRTASVWESVMWAIVGQQVNLAFAYRLRRVLVELCGRAAPNGLRAHPTPEEVALLEYADLTARQFSRSKAQYVIDTARLIASGGLDVEALPGLDPRDAEQSLTAVRGIGTWTANYVMMRGCAFPDCVPAGDSALSASLRAYFALDHKVDALETRALMERFAPWRSLATYHFWLRLAASGKP
jgi:3-methyladenine DNA glycosylase/8-oxoguanine DNA glycosylase